MTHASESSDARGFTLVELMVVVAILGILAALAVGAYTQQIDKGRITQMKQYAMEVEKGQKQYASRNGRFFSPSPTVYKSTKSNLDQWIQLLEFDHDSMNPDTRVITEAGTQGSSCTICPANVSPDTTQNWYAIKVCRSMDGNSGTGTDCSNDTTVYLDNVRDEPMVMRSGQ